MIEPFVSLVMNESNLFPINIFCAKLVEGFIHMLDTEKDFSTSFHSPRTNISIYDILTVNTMEGKTKEHLIFYMHMIGI